MKELIIGINLASKYAFYCNIILFYATKEYQKKSYTLLLLIKSFDLLTNKNNENLKVLVLFPLLKQ